MPPRRLFAAVALLLASAALHAAQPVLPDTEREMVERSNAFRALQGLPALQPDPALTRAARAFAAFMAQTDRYGHEADGRQPVQRAQAGGYVHCMVAENIGWQFHSGGFASSPLARAFVQGWIDSPPHRRNLLAPDATDIAIAVARSAASGRYYAVQMLGRPAALRTRFELSNHSRQDVRYTVGGQPFPLPPGATRRHEQCTAAAGVVERPGRGPATLQPPANGRYRIDEAGDGLRLSGG